MKLIINASNLYGSGGLQVAYSFIHECRKFAWHEYHVFLCPKLTDQIEIQQFPSNFIFYHSPVIPAPFGKARQEMLKLSRLEREISPDIVFTVFGPTYWTPRATHLMGYAMPHFIYTDSPFFQIISWKENVIWKLRGFIKMWYVKRNTRYFHVETDDVRQRLAAKLKIPVTNIFTVGNTHNASYDAFNPENAHASILPDMNGTFNLVCISGSFEHKNLDILNRVIPELKHLGVDDVRFILTIEPEKMGLLFSAEAREWIVNTGPVPVDVCPVLYHRSDAVFLPTLLECFSANYPEAMKMERPLVTSGMGFARTICGDAALYFDPVDPEDIAEKIKRLRDDALLREALVDNGRRVLAKLNTAESRAQQYLHLCEQLANQNKQL